MITAAEIGTLVSAGATLMVAIAAYLRARAAHIAVSQHADGPDHSQQSGPSQLAVPIQTRQR